MLSSPLQVLPLIIFFYAMISVLYYLGVMQFIVRNIGQALAFFLGTSPAESLNAAGNIFVGMVKSIANCFRVLHTLYICKMDFLKTDLAILALHNYILDHHIPND